MLIYSLQFDPLKCANKFIISVFLCFQEPTFLTRYIERTTPVAHTAIILQNVNNLDRLSKCHEKLEKISSKDEKRDVKLTKFEKVSSTEKTTLSLWQFQEKIFTSSNDNELYTLGNTEFPLIVLLLIMLLFVLLSQSVCWFKNLCLFVVTSLW